MLQTVTWHAGGEQDEDSKEKVTLEPTVGITILEELVVDLRRITRDVFVAQFVVWKVI